MIRIGTKVRTVYPYRFSYPEGVVIQSPFCDVKGWNRVYAWVEWKNGHHSAVEKCNLVRL